MPNLRELLQTVQVTEPRETLGLQVFGLRWEGNGALTYATLDEALAAGALEVTEVSEGGSVPTLRVVNKSDTLVFLMAGEQLIGAKQNRVLNASLLVPAQSTLPIPVSCVEAGRWHYRSAKFASLGTMSHGLLRKMMSAQAKQGYRKEGKPTSQQGQVWAEVSRKLHTLGTVSLSSALHAAYEEHEASLAAVPAQLPPPPDCHGVAFALAGKVVGADLFDRPATLAKLWPKLTRAYALDALEVRETAESRVSAEAVRRWVRSGADAKAEPFKSPGLGHDVRLEAANLVGAGLVVEEHPVHVELFAQEEPQGSEPAVK